MFILGIVLLLAAIALAAWVFYGLNGAANQIHFDAWGIKADLSPLTVFLLGALTLLLIWAATRLFAMGTKRKYRAHQDKRALKKEHKAIERDRDAAVAERDQVRDERDAEIASRETAEARARVWERDARGTHTEPMTGGRHSRDVADDARDLRDGEGGSRPLR